MDDMEQKLNSILGNSELMSQIMAMAQALGQGDAPKAQAVPKTPPPQTPPQSSMPDLPDLSLLQKVASIASQTSVDANQKTLLNALCPYLSPFRLQKLEKAMRAAKLAQFASSALAQSQGNLFSGR